MSPETETKVALVLAALRLLQANDAAPPAGEITPEYLSDLSHELGEPFSAKTIRNYTRTALSKARHQIAAPDFKSALLTLRSEQ